MKSIVTGGCGFIGSHIVDRLIELGHEVVVIDSQTSSTRTEYFFNDDAFYYKKDLSDYGSMEWLFEGVDYVFHLASEISIPYCIAQPRETMQNNVLSTLNVLEASRKYGIKRVVFSSTSAVYGNSFFLPSVETNPVDCLNTYSISKYSCEQLCQMYYNLYGLKTVIFRYFNVYGERQPLVGSYAPVLGIFLRQKNNNEPLTLVGEGYQTRDFIHVSDVVSANIIAGQKDLHKYGEVFNVGTGLGTSIESIANLISPLQLNLPERIGEVIHSRANLDKIKGILDWEPKVNVFEWLKGQL
jgi:UDP-glucose 4-epimerase